MTFWTWTLRFNDFSRRWDLEGFVPVGKFMSLDCISDWRLCHTNRICRPYDISPSVYSLVYLVTSVALTCCFSSDCGLIVPKNFAVAAMPYQMNCNDMALPTNERLKIRRKSMENPDIQTVWNISGAMSPSSADVIILFYWKFCCSFCNQRYFCQ